MFGSLMNLVESAIRVVAVPVDLTLSVANKVIEPIADTLEVLAKDVKSIFD